MERYILSPDLYPKRIVRLWLHQHQFQRFLTGVGFIHHLLLAIFRLMIDLLMLPDFGRPQMQMTIRMWWYELTLWVVTNLLFRRLDRFFWFRRPGKAYQFSVYAIIFAAPVPLVIMHIWTIALASGYDRGYGGKLVFEISLWSAVAALVTLLPIHGLYICMARRFLLADNDLQYEPTRQKSLYRDHPAPTSPSLPQGMSYLRNASIASLNSTHSTRTTSARATLEPQIPIAGSETTTNTVAPPESDTRPMVADLADRCPATGYVDAIPNVLRGYQAWLRYPLVYKTLAFYMAFLTWEMIVIIRAKTIERYIKYE
jgi:hypothetical protein